MKRLWLLVVLASVFLNLNAQNGQQLKELDEQYTTPLFRTQDSHVLVPMDDKSSYSAFNVFHYLQGRVPGLQVYNATSLYPYVRYRFGFPALFLNEVRTDFQMLSAISINDIAMVKVFRPPFMGAFGAGNGAIAVYTKLGEEEEGD